MQPFFILGAERGDHIRIEVIGRAHPTASDFWDGNWVNARISARAGGFHGDAAADLRTTDFAIFREQLQILYERLTGEAKFETLERRVEIQLVGDGRGHMETKVILMENQVWAIGSSSQCPALIKQIYSTRSRVFAKLRMPIQSSVRLPLDERWS